MHNTRMMSCVHLPVLLGQITAFKEFEFQYCIPASSISFHPFETNVTRSSTIMGPHFPGNNDSHTPAYRFEIGLYLVACATC